MRIFYTPVLIFIILFTTSCTKSNQIINCLGNFDEPNISFLPNKQNCDTVLSNTINLDEASKEYAPQFCDDIGTRYIYKNKKNESKSLLLIEKFHGRTGVSGTRTFNCPNTGVPGRLFYKLEEIRLVFLLEGINQKISVSIKPILDKNNPDLIGDWLGISRESSSISNFEINAILTKRSLPWDYFFQEHFTTIDLNQINFKNVLSNDLNKFIGGPPSYKFYYNTEGLVAFLDLNKELWVLVK